MEAEGLARRIGQPPIVARDLLRAHHETYRKFWAWSDAAVDRAMLTGSLWTTFGWPIHIGENPNPRSLRNFPMQANGAEMLRLAACFATEQGIEVCALIHDAVLIAAPLEQLEADAARMQAAMAKASRIVLAGFELRTDVKFVRHPDRYHDPRGALMWDRVMRLIAQREAIQTRGGVMVDDRTRSILRALRVDPERVRQPARPKKWRRQFVRVPWQWVERLRKAKRISTYRLALVLLYEHWRTGGRPIVLSNVVCSRKVCPPIEVECTRRIAGLGLDHGGNADPASPPAWSCATSRGTNMRHDLCTAHLGTIVSQVSPPT